MFIKPIKTPARPRPLFKKSTQFGAIKIVPTSISKPTEQVIQRSDVAATIFGHEEETEEEQDLSKAYAKAMQAQRIKNGIDAGMSEIENAEEDPFDAFMQNVQSELITLEKTNSKANDALLAEMLEDFDPIEEEREEQVFESPEDVIAAAAAKIAAKRKEILSVDHSKMNYEPFRKDFFIEPAEVAAMTKEEIDEIRKKRDFIKVRGTNVPKPVQKWTHFGLPAPVLEVIRKVLKYSKPSPIQSQAIPAIMSGRDVIGVAKTGSGKVIFLLILL